MNDEVSKKTVDKGWKAMRTALDREMPVRQKRRTVIWWWLLFLGLPVISWSIYNATGNNQNSPDKTPAAPQSVQKAPMATTKPDGEPAMSAEPAMTEISRPVVLQEPSSHTPAPPVSVNEPANTENPVLISSFEPRLPLKPETVDAKQALAPPVDTMAGTAFLQDRAKFVPVLDLPFQSVNRSTIGADLSLKSISQDNPLRKPRKAAWKLGVTASIQTENFKKFNSLSAGLCVDWKPFRKWGIRSGLNFSRYYAATSTQSVAVIQPNKYQAATDSSFIIIDDLGNTVSPAYGGQFLAENVNVPLQHYDVFELPVWLSWRAFRFLSFQTGIHVAYVAKIKTASQGQSGELTVIPTSEKADQNINRLITSQTNRWKYFFYAGAGIPVNKNLEISAGIKLPLKSVRLAKAQGLGSYLDGNIGNETKSRNTVMINLGVTYLW